MNSECPSCGMFISQAATSCKCGWKIPRLSRPAPKPVEQENFKRASPEVRAQCMAEIRKSLGRTA